MNLTDSLLASRLTAATTAQQSDPCPARMLHPRYWSQQRQRIRGTGTSVLLTSTASECCVWRNGCCSATSGTDEGHVVPESLSAALPAHGVSGVPAADGQQSRLSRCSPHRPGSRHRSRRSPLTTSLHDRRRRVPADCFLLIHADRKRDT